MSLFHALRLLAGAVAAGIAGWLTFIALTGWRLLRAFEGVETTAHDDGLDRLSAVFDDTIRNTAMGTAVFFSGAAACLIASALFRTRSLLYYAGIAGAVTVAVASALLPEAQRVAEQDYTALAIGGFSTGLSYWLFAGRSKGRV